MTDTTNAAIDAMVAPLRRIAFWLPALWPDRMANMIQALAAERDAALRERDDAMAFGHAAARAGKTRAEKAETEAAALRDEVARMREALGFYKDAWSFTTGKRYGGLAWKPKEELLDDCGNIARAALTSKGGEG